MSSYTCSSFALPAGGEKSSGNVQARDAITKMCNDANAAIGLYNRNVDQYNTPPNFRSNGKIAS